MADSSEPHSPAPPDPPAGRRKGIAVLVAVLVVVGVAAVIIHAPDDAAKGPLDEARHLVADDGNFATATDTGLTFTRISTVLQSAGEQCRKDGGPGATCDARFAGAAYARVSAASVLTCTRPGVFEARAAMRTFLDELATTKAADTPPDPPAITRCR
jgi:hypothetical protein